MDDRMPVHLTVTLGLLTIVGFGVWFYGYGVLLEPIRSDTGWSEAVLSSVYGVSLLGAGALATVAGRMLHRRGSRSVYLMGSGIVLPAYLAAAASGTEMAFAAFGILAGSVTGGLGTYAAVHTVIAQLVPAARRPRALTTNTLWGAFASPVFLPLMAWTVLRLEWRATLQLVGAVVAASFLLAAFVIPDRQGEAEHTPSLRAAMAEVGRDRGLLALVTATFAGGLVTSVLILYQVPVMVAGGLSLAAASGLAGARGFLQLVGRLPMPWLVRRHGSRKTLRLAHLLTGASCLILPLAGDLAIAVVFAVVAGVAIGALVPVESIFVTDAVREHSLGLVFGISSLTRGVGAALGPVVGGALSTSTGTRTPTLLLVAVVAVLAAAVVPPARSGRSGGYAEA